MPDERALRHERRDTKLDGDGRPEREAGRGGTPRAVDQVAEPEHSASLGDAPAKLASAGRPVDGDCSTLSDAEVAEYRRRIVDGVYNSRDVADEVARRLLQSRDI